MDEQTKDVVTVIGKSRAVNFTGVPYCVEEVDSKQANSTFYAIRYSTGKRGRTPKWNPIC